MDSRSECLKDKTNDMNSPATYTRMTSCTSNTSSERGNPDDYDEIPVQVTDEDRKVHILTKTYMITLTIDYVEGDDDDDDDESSFAEAVEETGSTDLNRQWVL